MEIISHRGLWKLNEDKNCVVAFEQSFKNNFGTETDFRDYNGEIVISHDIATKESIKASTFFEIYKSYNQKSKLALNIKADGLHQKMLTLLNKYEIKNYFVFDMSIPDTIGYANANINFFSRQSEHELIPSLYDKCSGIWLDSFERIWYDQDLIKNHINNKKTITFVSPELHKREYLSFWEFLKNAEFSQNSNLVLCTDFPEQAEQYFN